MDGSGDPPDSKKRKLAWSSAEESRLIQLYRQFSLLWDNRLPDYYKKDRRQCALRTIASQMGDKFTVGNVRDKIKTLRDYYVKEKKREESKRKHNFRGYVPRWEHFASLEFLRHCTASSDPRDLRPNEPSLTIKCEPPEVYPAFPDGEGPGSVILPPLADDSSDDDGEPASDAHQGAIRAAQGVPPQECPNTSLLQPGPSETTTAIAEHGPNLAFLQPGPSGMTMSPAEKRPNPDLLQHGPAVMSMVRAEHGCNPGTGQPSHGIPMVHADQRPNQGLFEPRPGERPTGHAERTQNPDLLQPGISGISRGLGEQTPNPVLLHPGPYGMSTAHASHEPNTALLQPEPSDMSARPNPGVLQPPPSGMLNDYAEHGPNTGLLQPSLSGMPRGLGEQRPNPDLSQPGASLMPTSFAGPSAGNGPTTSAQPTPTAAASPAESSEGNERPVVTPGPGHHSPDSGLEPELGPGAIAPCPVPLEDEGEVLFYQLLMLQLAGMSDYDQGVAKVRMQEAMFDIKHNFEPPPSPGGPAP